MDKKKIISTTILFMAIVGSIVLFKMVFGEEYGIVLEQSIEPGMNVDENTKLILYVSNGLKSSKEGYVKVPNAVGEDWGSEHDDDWNDASDYYASSNLEYELTYMYHDEIEYDDVISQSVEPGTEVPYGTVISICISNGDDPTTILKKYIPDSEVVDKEVYESGTEIIYYADGTRISKYGAESRGDVWIHQPDDTLIHIEDGIAYINKYGEDGQISKEWIEKESAYSEIFDRHGIEPSDIYDVYFYYFVDFENDTQYKRIVNSDGSFNKWSDTKYDYGYFGSSYRGSGKGVKNAYMKLHDMEGNEIVICLSEFPLYDY